MDNSKKQMKFGSSKSPTRRGPCFYVSMGLGGMS